MGIGNPLLDISAHVGQEMLDKCAANPASSDAASC